MNRAALSFLSLPLLVVAATALHAERAVTVGTTTALQTLPAPQRLDPSKNARPTVVVSEPAREIKHELEEHLKPALMLEYASFIVAVVTCIFAVLAVVGVFDWLRSEKLRRALAAQFVELGQERVHLQKLVETFKSEIQAQEQQLAANQRFLDAVLSHHSTLLVGIVEGFGASLEPEEARSLKSLIFEAEAALDLFYPDESEVFKALLRLEQIGSDGCVPSLVELRDDKTLNPEIRMLAQQVLTKVKERLRRASPPA